MTVRIGFVGAGLMGHGAAKHLLQAGHRVTVMAHRNRAPIDDLLGRGAAEARSVGELTAGAEVVMLCLPDAERVEAVAYAAGGLVENAHPGLLVLDLTTSLPAVTRALGSALEERGTGLLDAPMTRTPKEAEEGQLNLLLGGTEALVSRARPIVECFCENVWHIGPLGAAHAFKLLNNAIVIANIATTLEAAVAAKRLGIEHQLLLDIAGTGGAASAMLAKILPYAASGDDSGFQAHTSTLLKDIRYFHQLTAEAGLSSTMSHTAQELFQRLAALGHTETLVPRLYDVLVRD